MHYSSKDPNIWRNNYTTPSCNSSIGTIPKLFCNGHLLPKIKSLQLVGGKTVSLPYFDFKDMFVTGKKLNQPQDMIREDVDREIWKPTKHMDDRSDDDMMSNVNSGIFFHEGMALTDLSTDLSDNVDKVRVVGLQFFIDKSRSDHIGALATIPISYSLRCFNKSMGRKNKAWRQEAYVPNLDIVQGTNKGFDPQRARDKASGKKIGSKYKTKLNTLKNQHILY